MALVSAAAIVVAAIAIGFATRPAGGNAKDLIQPPTRYAADLTDGAAVGSPTAPVVLELFSDFQCPACRHFVNELLPRLLIDYVQPGIVRVEARDIDVIGGSRQPDESIELAAGAACAAEQDRYWQYHDLVFWNQGRENRGDHDANFIAAIADQAGVDRSAFDGCLARADIRQPIRQRTAAAAAAGIQSTPTLRLNGVVRVGVPAYDELAALIDRLAAAASPPMTPGAPSGVTAPTPAPSASPS